MVLFRMYSTLSFHLYKTNIILSQTLRTIL